VAVREVRDIVAAIFARLAAEGLLKARLAAAALLPDREDMWASLALSARAASAATATINWATIWRAVVAEAGAVIMAAGEVRVTGTTVAVIWVVAEAGEFRT
jgi:hypothetical protein